MKNSQEFIATWKSLGWIAYLALAGLLVCNLSIIPLLSAGISALFWSIFAVGLIAAFVCSLFYHRHK